MLAKTKISTLMAIAGGGGIGVGIMALLLNKEQENFANQASFVQSAVSVVRGHSTVMDLLGNDFQVGRASLQDGWGKMGRKNIQVMIPIKGENDRANLFVYARKIDPKEKFKLFKLEMTFDKVKGKKLVLMDIEESLLKEEEERRKKEEEDRKKEFVLDDKFITDPNKKKTNHSYK